MLLLGSVIDIHRKVYRANAQGGNGKLGGFALDGNLADFDDAAVPLLANLYRVGLNTYIGHIQDIDDEAVGFAQGHGVDTDTVLGIADILIDIGVKGNHRGEGVSIAIAELDDQGVLDGFVQIFDIVVGGGGPHRDTATLDFDIDQALLKAGVKNLIIADIALPMKMGMVSVDRKPALYRFARGVLIVNLDGRLVLTDDIYSAFAPVVAVLRGCPDFHSSLGYAGENAVLIHGDDAFVLTGPEHGFIGGIVRDDPCRDGLGAAHPYRGVTGDLHILHRHPLILALVHHVDCAAGGHAGVLLAGGGDSGLAHLNGGKDPLVVHRNDFGVAAGPGKLPAGVGGKGGHQHKAFARQDVNRGMA